MQSVANESRAYRFYSAAKDAKEIKLDTLVTADDKKSIPDNRVGKWRKIVNLHIPWVPGIAIETKSTEPPTFLAWPDEKEVVAITELKDALNNKRKYFSIRRYGKIFTYTFR